MCKILLNVFMFCTAALKFKCWTATVVHSCKVLFTFTRYTNICNFYPFCVKLTYSSICCVGRCISVSYYLQAGVKHAPFQMFSCFQCCQCWFICLVSWLLWSVVSNSFRRWLLLRRNRGLQHLWWWSGLRAWQLWKAHSAINHGSMLARLKNRKTEISLSNCCRSGM